MKSFFLRVIVRLATFLLSVLIRKYDLDDSLIHTGEVTIASLSRISCDSKSNANKKTSSKE